MVKHRGIILSKEELKTVLIITYYWPPAGGPGVQRVLKFAKYLPQFGWRPIILTVRNGEYPAIDNSLINDIPDNLIVHKTNTLEPSGFYRKFVGMKPGEAIPVAVLTEKNPSLKKRISNWIRANLFIPDAKIGWIPFAVKKGKKIIKTARPDIILSSSPPPTVHLIACKLAKWSGIKWVADFRDPWTNIYHYHNAPKWRLAKSIDSRMEQKVLTAANSAITVTEGFFDISPVCATHVLPNGFDPDDYRNITPNISAKKQNRSSFTICYMGSLKTRQYVDSFFNSLVNLQRQYKNTDMQITLKIIGVVEQSVRGKIQKYENDIRIIFTGYLDHQSALREAADSDMLVMFIGKSNIAGRILTGKLFEYLMLKKPILAYGPLNGAAHQILQATNVGMMFDYEDVFEPQHYIEQLIENRRKNKPVITINSEEVERYNRVELTKKLAKIFEDLL